MKSLSATFPSSLTSRTPSDLVISRQQKKPATRYPASLQKPDIPNLRTTSRRLLPAPLRPMNLRSLQRRSLSCRSLRCQNPTKRCRPSWSMREDVRQLNRKRPHPEWRSPPRIVRDCTFSSYRIPSAAHTKGVLPFLGSARTYPLPVWDRSLYGTNSGLKSAQSRIVLRKRAIDRRQNPI